jgi:hypothetical protein
MLVKLMERGELKPADLADAAQKATESTLDLALTCPECGALNLFESGQCPDCGYSKATTQFKALDSKETAPLASQPAPHLSRLEPADEVVLEESSDSEVPELEDDLMDLTFLDNLGEERLPEPTEQTEQIAEPEEAIPEPPPPPPPPRKRNTYLYIAAAALFGLAGIIGVGLYTEMISLPFGTPTEPPMAVQKPPARTTTPGPPLQRIAATKPTQPQAQTPAPVPSEPAKAVAPAPVQEKPPAPAAARTEPAKDVLSTAKELREVPQVKPSTPEPSAKAPEKLPAYEKPTEITLETVEEPEPAVRTAQESVAKSDKPAVAELPDKPVQAKSPEVTPTTVVAKPDSSPKVEKPTQPVESQHLLSDTKPRVARLVEPSPPQKPVEVKIPEPESRAKQQASVEPSAQDRRETASPRKTGMGPLVRDAIMNQDPDTLKLLLDRGADPDIADAEGVTPLMNAARTRCLACVTALLEHGADVRRTDQHGNTALDVARRAGRTRAAELILAHDPEKGPAALLIASREGLADIVQVLVENGVNVNATDKDGNTALIAASENGNLAVVSMLLKKGADVRARNHRGQTALTVLSQTGSSSGRLPSRVRRELVRLLGQQATSESESLQPTR